jgi:hypothetical protein
MYITCINEKIAGVILLPQDSASKLGNNGRVLYRFYQEHLKGCRPRRQVYQPESHRRRNMKLSLHNENGGLTNEEVSLRLRCQRTFHLI